jgi:phage tail-like protein
MTEASKKFIDMLPGIFRSKDRESQGFLEKYLTVFEEILTGLDETLEVDGVPVTSIYQKIDVLPSNFYPESAPPEFLDWLSSWVGLVLREDWEEDKKRKVIARIIPLYRMRGTKKGLEEYLNIYTRGGVTINDEVGLFQVGINTRVGTGTAIDLTSYFIVEVRLSASEQTMDAISRKKYLIETIVEREKPVHTRYKLSWKNVQSLQVGIHSKVEVDTLLWSSE